MVSAASPRPARFHVYGVADRDGDHRDPGRSRDPESYYPSAPRERSRPDARPERDAPRDRLLLPRQGEASVEFGGVGFDGISARDTERPALPRLSVEPGPRARRRRKFGRRRRRREEHGAWRRCEWKVVCGLLITTPNTVIHVPLTHLLVNAPRHQGFGQTSRYPRRETSEVRATKIVYRTKLMSGHASSGALNQACGCRFCLNAHLQEL